MIPGQLVPWRIVALAGVVMGLLTVASVYRVQRDSARDELRLALDREAAAAVAGQQQAREAAERERTAAEITGRVADALSTDRGRERDRAAGLAERLRDREDRLRACTVPGVPGGPADASGAAPEPGSGGGAGEAIAALPAACLDDAAKVIGWQRWYAGQRAVAP